MPDKIFSLQAAVYTHLSSDSALQAQLGSPLRLYDLPPTNAVFPYLTFGTLEVRDYSTKSGTGQSLTFTVDIWSRERGSKQTKQIMSLLRERLHDAALTLSVGHLARCQEEFSGLTREADGLTTHGQTRFRAVVTSS
jgi:hypothetical protein